MCDELLLLVAHVCVYVICSYSTAISFNSTRVSLPDTVSCVAEEIASFSLMASLMVLVIDLRASI